MNVGVCIRGAHVGVFADIVFDIEISVRVIVETMSSAQIVTKGVDVGKRRHMSITIPFRVEELARGKAVCFSLAEVMYNRMAVYRCPAQLRFDVPSGIKQGVWPPLFLSSCREEMLDGIDAGDRHVPVMGAVPMGIKQAEVDEFVHGLQSQFRLDWGRHTPCDVPAFRPRRGIGESPKKKGVGVGVTEI